MTDKIEKLKKAIEAQKRYMRLQEMSNDSYYISSSYKEDKQYLFELEQQLRQECKE